MFKATKIFASVALAVSIFAADASAASFKVALDQAKPLMLQAPAAGVVVGNPAIAGVSLQSDRLLFITGRAYGTTNLIVVGANGRPIYESRVTVTADEKGTAVLVTKGTSTVRHDCAPMCRRTPDVADDVEQFEQVNKQVEAHAGTAKANQ